MRDAVPEGDIRGTIDQLAAEQYVVKSLTQGDRKTVLLVGGDGVGTLYAAYQFAEQLGVRFYLHGDVIPDQRVPWNCRTWTRRESRCSRRGAFNRSTISRRARIGGMPRTTRRSSLSCRRLRMNFFGLHTYPEGGVGPEPTVWIGSPR